MATATVSEPILSAPLLDDSQYEVVDGLRVELPPMAARSTRIASVLTLRLGSFATDGGLGRVDAEMLYQLDRVRDLQRRPDVAFASFERWPRGTDVPDDAAWDVVPDLAIEVVSPADRAQDLLHKVREYFLAGVRAVWVVYPKEHVFHVFDSFASIRVLTLGDDLDGGAIFPGFRLPLAAIFELQTGAQNGN